MRSPSVAQLQLAARVPPRTEKRQREDEAISFAGCLEGLLQPAAAGPPCGQTAAGEVTGAHRPSPAGQVEGSQAEGVTVARKPEQASGGEVEAKGVNTAMSGEVFQSEVVPARPVELLASLAEGGALVMVRNPVKVAGEGLGLAQAAPGPQGRVFFQGSPELALAAEGIAENIPLLLASQADMAVDKAVAAASQGMKNKGSSGAQGPEPDRVVPINNGAETSARVGGTLEGNNEKLLLPRSAREDFSEVSPKPRDNLASSTTLSPGDRIQGSWGTPGVEASNGGKIANLHELAARVISTAQLEKKWGRQELELQLRPEGLGKVRLHTILMDNRLSVQMLVETPQAGRLLQMSLPELRQVLQSQGLQLEQLQVEIDHGYSGGRPDLANREGKSNAGRGGFLDGLEQDHLTLAPVGMSYLLNYLA